MRSTHTRTYTTVEVLVMPGMTIEALIKKYNNYKVDRIDVEELMIEFNQLNPHALPPRPGMKVHIPIIPTCEN